MFKSLDIDVCTPLVLQVLPDASDVIFQSVSEVIVLLLSAVDDGRHSAACEILFHLCKVD